jgi:hypothetical protein
VLTDPGRTTTTWAYRRGAIRTQEAVCLILDSYIKITMPIIPLPEFPLCWPWGQIDLRRLHPWPRFWSYWTWNIKSCSLYKWWQRLRRISGTWNVILSCKCWVKCRWWIGGKDPETRDIVTLLGALSTIRISQNSDNQATVSPSQSTPIQQLQSLSTGKKIRWNHIGIQLCPLESNVKVTLVREDKLTICKTQGSHCSAAIVMRQASDQPDGYL